MGGKSSNASSSSQQTTSNTHNESLNSALSGDIEERGLGVVGETNTVTQYITDGGAFDVVRDTNQQAVNGLGEALGSVDSAISSNESITNGALDLIDRALAGVGGIVSQLSENQLEVMGSANALAGTAVTNLAAATGAQPVEIKPPMTEKTKIALGVAGAVAMVGVAFAVRGKH